VSRAWVAIWAALVLVAITALTFRASVHQDVVAAARAMWADPWGRATLVDTYGAFAAVWLGILARERSVSRSLLWLLAIILTGNAAISVYILLALYRLPAGASWREAFVAPAGGGR